MNCSTSTLAVSSAPVAGPDGIVGHAGAEAEGEDIRIRVWPADKAIALALEGGMPNSVTTIGLLWLAAKRDYLRTTMEQPMIKDAQGQTCIGCDGGVGRAV